MNQEEATELLWYYQQLTQIVAAEKNYEFKKNIDFARIDKLLSTELPKVFENSAPPNIYELIKELNLNYGLLKDSIAYGVLWKKTVVGFGGGFSSGKSSFINSFLRDGEILPENIDPSTSVPTYIVHGNENKVRAINIFQKNIDLDLFCINAISHGFGYIADKTRSVELGHLIRNLILETPLFKYKNIAFLDTPGYSKPDDVSYSDKTDEIIARQQLNTSNYAVWFSPVSESGSLSESDIVFIKSLRKDLRLSIICSKSNRRTEQQRDSIKQVILKQINEYELNVDNVFFFDTESPGELDSDEISKMFDDINDLQYDGTVLGKAFKKFFIKLGSYYMDLNNEISKQIGRINQALVCIEGNETVRLSLNYMLDDLTLRRKEIVVKQEKVQSIENELFLLIENISEKYDFPFEIPESEKILSEVYEEKAKSNSIKRASFGSDNKFSKLAKERLRG